MSCTQHENDKVDNQLQHQAVMKEIATDLLVTNKSGIYIDATFGRGGHSTSLLSQLSQTARVIGIDRDQQAIEFGQTHFKDEPRMRLYHLAFSKLSQLVNDLGMTHKIDGILLDLGTSSPQLDNADRGFSFMREGPLDMRMDQSQGETLAEWLQKTSVKDLTRVLKEYGEERFAKRVATAIVKHCEQQPLVTTTELVKIVLATVPHQKNNNKHPATRSFQALRIAVNNELEELRIFLNSFEGMLKVGGRLVVISFHSLEDRMVKQGFANLVKPVLYPKHLPVQHESVSVNWKLVVKSLTPELHEVSNNVRSRSARLRAIEKVG